jgi:hypothetical protein
MSCNNDDDDPKASNDLIGVWTVESSSIEMIIGDKSIIEFLMEMLSITQEEAELFADIYLSDYGAFEGTITFKDDNTYAADFGDGVDTGTWKLSSDGKTLTLDQGTDDETDVQVITLSSVKLQIEITEASMEDIDDDGTDDEVSVKISLTLKK